MGALSNFLRLVDASLAPAPGPQAPPQFRPAQRQQIHPALRLILGGPGGKPADESAVLDFLRFAVRRGIDLNDLWVADRGGRVAWAVLPMLSPGRTMLLLAPPGDRARGENSPDPAAGLLDAVCAHFAARGILLAQALLDSVDVAGLGVYLDRHFDRMAELIYLDVDLRRRKPDATPLPDGLDWITYDAPPPVHPDTHAAFARTIVESYRDSLDCPSLNGLRDVEHVIAGHKASGVGAFEPSWWFLLRERGEPVAVLLLSRTGVEGDAAELVYLGLVPAARGRGLGDLVMRHALEVAAAGGARSLALAVDAGNAPALKLYHRHGMRRVGSKLALLRDLRAAPGRAGRAILHAPSTRPIKPCSPR